MNCTEFADWMGPYLSGEIGPDRRTAFMAHRAGCAQCARSLEVTLASDDQIRRAVMTESVDITSVLAAVKVRLASEASRRRWIGIAAATLLALGGGGYWASANRVAPGLYTAAARDHRLEVIEGRTRRWKTAMTEVEPLLADYRVAWRDVQALLPVGFVLQKARQCGISGQPVLHLVFSDGNHSLSIYVRAQGTAAGGINPGTETHMDGMEVAGFRRGDISGVVVSSGAPGLCAEAARRLSSL